LQYSNDHRYVLHDGEVVDLTKYTVLPIVIGHQVLSSEKRMRPYMDQYKNYLIKWEQENSKI
jgi:hypothetical protein